MRHTGEPGSLPQVLAAGGTWHWGSARIDWTFELGDGWDLEEVTNVFLVPFVGDRIVVLRLPTGHSAIGGTVEPGEHWCVTATRELLEEAGARLRPDSPGPLLHPFGILRCRSHAPRPYRSHQPHPLHARVAAWCEVEIVGEPTQPEDGENVEEALLVDLDEATRLLTPDAVALCQLAAGQRGRGVNDATWSRDNVRLLEEHYLRAPTPEGQSGKLGDAADWELSRKLVVRPVHHDGTFLDLGCANGLLMESVQRWAAEGGRRLEPYGLDASERLVSLARERLPHWYDRFILGNALTWTPPRPFDFVHTMVDLVPPRRRPDWLRRVLREMVAPGGRLSSVITTGSEISSGRGACLSRGLPCSHAELLGGHRKRHGSMLRADQRTMSRPDSRWRCERSTRADGDDRRVMQAASHLCAAAWIRLRIVTLAQDLGSLVPA